MRSQYVDSFAGSTSNNINNNTSCIPYHARVNSLPFSYGEIKPKSATTLMTTHRNGSYDTMNMIGSGANTNKSRDNNNSKVFCVTDNLDSDFEAIKINENCSRNIRNNNINANIYTYNHEPNNEMIKPQTRLTSPLLVRKTLNNPNSKSINTIANTYPYNNSNKNNNRNNINKENKLYSDDFDGCFYHETPSHNVPFVTLNGTLDKHYYNNSLSSAFRKSPILEQREKAFNNNKISNTIHLDTRVPTKNCNLNNKDAVSSNKICTNDSIEQYNYDFQFNLTNLMDGQNDREKSDAPVPPRRHYTLECTEKLSPRNTVTPKSSSQNNWRTKLPAELILSPTINSYETHAGDLHLYTEHSERTPLVLDVGYKRHFEMLQKQREQWPGYNNFNRYNNQSSNATTYGNEYVASYHRANNNNSNENVSKNHSWKEADINSQYDAAPIYATSMKQGQKQNKHTTLIENTTAGKIFYDETDFYRPETPAFPVTPQTPSLGNTLKRETLANNTLETVYQGLASSNMNSSAHTGLNGAEPQEVAAHLVKFANDSSRFWYKPNLSREEAIALLINATPGSFIVRDSTTYKNAYGLVVRVLQPPPGVAATGKPDDLVRHFLIEPTTRGVRLKGCANEPVFTSLSALVYEHSVNQLALPCLLYIPDVDLLPPRTEPTPAQRQLLTQGAACNVLLLFSAETESLTGEEAIRKAIRQMYQQKPLPTPIEVHFKVSQQGITLTDNTRKRFFRKHYGTDTISYCAIDPDNRLWNMHDESQLKKTIFAFVARRSPSSKDNQCHIFCDLAINQPASAIVSFVNKTLPTKYQRNIKL